MARKKAFQDGNTRSTLYYRYEIAIAAYKRTSNI